MPLPRTIGTGRALLGRAPDAWWLAGGVAASACVGAYQAKGAASLAASRVNLANPGTYDLTDGVAPTWAAATGWTFNGNSQYLNTGITPAQSWSMIVRFANGASSGWGILVGTYAPLANSFALFQVGPGPKSYYTNAADLTASTLVQSGVLALAAKKAYKNGVSDGTVGAGVLIAPPTITIGKGNGSSYFYTGDIIAIAIYNATLSAAQVAAITTAMNAL